MITHGSIQEEIIDTTHTKNNPQSVTSRENEAQKEGGGGKKNY
jgi:hypothetical protein